MKKDLTIVGLVFCLIIQFGVSIKNSYYLSKLENELNNTIQVVYWLSDELDNYRLMVDSLNKEIDSNYKELEEYKDLRRIKKELDRSN